MSTAKTIAKNTTWLFLSHVLTNALGLIIIILIARFLGDTGLGKYSFAFAFSGLFLIFSDFGLTQLMIREIARDKKKTEKYFGNAFTLKLIFGLLTFILASLAITLTNNPLEVKIMVYISTLAMVILQFAYFHDYLLQAYQKMQYEAAVRVIEKVLVFMLIIFVLVYNLGLISLVAVSMIAFTISLILISFIVRKKIGRIKLQLDLDFCKSLLKQSWPFWLTGVFVLIYFKIDTVMLSFFKSYEVVGWYNAAYKLISGLNFIPTIFIVAVFPAMSGFFVKNKKNLSLLYQKSFKYLFSLGFPIAIGITLLADRVILFIYKEEFIRSGIALQILIWAELFVFVNYLIGYLLNSINKQKLFTYTTGFSAVVNIVLNLFLIPKYSYIGAAIATVVTEMINFLLLYYFSHQTNFRLNLRRIIVKPIIAGILMGFLIYYLRFLHILILVPLAALFYFFLLFISKGLGKEEINLIKNSFKR